MKRIFQTSRNVCVTIALKPFTNSCEVAVR